MTLEQLEALMAWTKAAIRLEGDLGSAVEVTEVQLRERLYGAFGFSTSYNLDDPHENWVGELPSYETFHVARAITAVRRAAGLTQRELAERTGIKQTIISLLERERGNPTVKTLRRIAEATGTQLRIGFKAPYDPGPKPTVKA